MQLSEHCTCQFDSLLNLEEDSLMHYMYIPSSLTHPWT